MEEIKKYLAIDSGKIKSEIALIDKYPIAKNAVNQIISQSKEIIEICEKQLKVNERWK